MRFCDAEQRRGAERVASLAQASAAVEKLLESGIAHKLTSALANADSTGLYPLCGEDKGCLWRMVGAREGVCL